MTSDDLTMANLFKLNKRLNKLESTLQPTSQPNIQVTGLELLNHHMAILQRQIDLQAETIRKLEDNLMIIRNCVQDHIQDHSIGDAHVKYPLPKS